MTDQDARKAPLKQRFREEMERYAITFVFLAAFFVALTTYRRLLLAEYHLGTFDYGFALVKALILAKLILIGDALHLGRRYERAPLALTTLYKTLVFSLFIAGFSAVERLTSALVHHRPIGSEFDFRGAAGDELLGRIVLETVAFIPFFAFRELGRVLGEKRLLDLFFRGRVEAPPPEA